MATRIFIYYYYCINPYSNSSFIIHAIILCASRKTFLRFRLESMGNSGSFICTDNFYQFKVGKKRIKKYSLKMLSLKYKLAVFVGLLFKPKSVNCKFHPDSYRTGFVPARSIESAAIAVIFISIFPGNLEYAKIGLI